MLVVFGRRVVLPDGVRPASIHVEDGVITRIGALDDAVGEAAVIDAGPLTVSPGIVDTHVHINEPGRTDWEGFDTATRAAAAGGVTTVIDMPLNSVPATTSVAALRAKRQAAERQAHVDVGFWGGVVPGNAGAIGPLLDEGVRGFKCFLTPSGVAEFAHVGVGDLREALPKLKAAGGTAPLLVHAEDPACLEAPAGDPRSYAAYLRTRPAAAEAGAIELVGRLSRELGVHVHIVHVSSAEGVAAIARLRAGGAVLTAETCPHYLSFTADDPPDGGTAFKCAPPIREGRHRDALWTGLADGTLQVVATDHSPSPPSMKQLETGNFFLAWGGIASLQLSLPAVWTEARRRGFGEGDLARWLSLEPARLAGIDARKGSLAAGRDADFVLWDPEAAFLVSGRQLEHRHPLTPYEGRPLAGAVRATYLRGECVWRAGTLVRPRGGRLL